MKYYIAILVTILLFSTVEVVTKKISSNIEPLYLAFLRYSISGIIIMTVGVAKEFKERHKLIDYLKLCGVGIIGITISIGFFHTALQYVKAAEAAVIFSTNPIFSAFFAWFFLKEKLNKNIVFGMLLAVIGVYIMTFGFKQLTIKDGFGAGLMLISAITFGLYIVLSKMYLKNHNVFFGTGLVFISGAVMYLPFINSFKINNFSEVFPVIMYLSIGTTGVAYIFYFYGLSKVNVAAGSSMFYLKPVIASLLAAIIIKESLGLNFMIGFVFIMIGMFLSTILPAIRKICVTNRS